MTRLLPRAEDLVGRITGLRVKTFTNEDDLGGSGPAVVNVGLLGHRARDGGPLRLEFGVNGLPSGTFTDEVLRFPSGGERFAPAPDRAPRLTFGEIALTTGKEEGNRLLDLINDWREAAAAGTLGSDHLGAMITAIAAPAVATGVGVAGWALADPLTVAVGALIAYGLIEGHDNWTTLAAIDAIVEDSAGLV